MHQTVRHLAAGFLFALSVGGIFIGGVSSAAAQALFLPPTTPDLAAAAAAPFLPQAVRNHLVRIDRNVLTRHIAPAGLDLAADRVARAKALDGVVTLNLFPDVTTTLRRSNVSAQAGGGVVWEGIVPGQPAHEALLVIGQNQIAGQVQLEHRIFRIDPIGGDVYRITEIDQTKFPPEAPPLLAPGTASAPVAPKDSATPAARVPVTVRVLVAYTTAAKNEAGGTAAIESVISQGVALANQAYTRGNIGINLVLAGKMEVTYKEGNNFTTDLNDLTTGSKLATVRAKRNQLNADLATLMRKSNSSTCGIGWLPGIGVLPTPSSATAKYGFQIVAQNCVVGNYSWHHEMGHNMGLQHDRFTYNEQGGGTPSTTYYDFGYINLSHHDRTIMAYNDECAKKGFNCTRLNWFSSATIKATGGIAIGHAQGTTGAADNTRRLVETRTAISKYQ